MFSFGQTRLAKARRSRIHGQGLFAKKDIPEGERIIEYTGEKITKAEGNRRYDEQAKANQIYLFELNNRYDIDGSTKGNIAKYANHSCDPNAETIVEKGEIWLVALKDIEKGEEITFDYNFPLFDYEKRPCKCGSDNCRGWIINRDSYNYLKRKKRQATKKGAKKALRKAPAKKVDAAKKTAPAKKATKKVGRKSAKKTGKKTSTKKAAKKSRKAVKKAGKKTSTKTAAKKSGKKSSKKAAKKSTKKAARKSGKRSSRKAAKKAGKKRAR